MRISDWSSDVCSSDLIDRLTIGAEGQAMAAKKAVEDGNFTVESVETKPATRNPPPPFTTSTLQQEAARKLGFSASHTLRIAQGLYEDGAITYKIGRESRRERVCQYVKISVVAATLKNKNKKK